MCKSHATVITKGKTVKNLSNAKRERPNSYLVFNAFFLEQELINVLKSTIQSSALLLGELVSVLQILVVVECHKTRLFLALLLPGVRADLPKVVTIRETTTVSC